MGIKFACPHCGTSLNVKSELAGKRGRCPQCQQKIEIPEQDSPGSDAAAVQAAGAPVVSSAATAAAPAGEPALQPSAAVASAPDTSAADDAISEAPKLQWYVMPPGAASQYGPAVGEEFRNWIKEGRVTADTLVWRQDWPEWKSAGAVFAELQPQAAGQAPVAIVAPTGFAIPTAAGALPTASGPLPMGVAAFPTAGDAMTPWNAAAGGFPPVGGAPTTSVRRTQYRKRSNTGPMIVIGALVLAMIPLSYFVWKVVSQQFSGSPPAASPKQPAE